MYKTIAKTSNAVEDLIRFCKCFTAGTIVKTSKDDKKIEQVRVGDKVLAKDDKTGKVAYKNVAWLFQKTVDKLYIVHVGKEKIQTTHDHPFWIKGFGWVAVEDLKAGMMLEDDQGKLLKIAKVEVKHQKSTVYNFKVEGFHTYYVSNLHVWTDNQCGTEVFNWNSIKGTQPNYPKTQVPRSFVINGLMVNGKEVWVHGNATKHIAEFVHASSKKFAGGKLVENEIMFSFMDAVEQASKKISKSGRNQFVVGGWEIGINSDTATVYHALMK